VSDQWYFSHAGVVHGPVGAADLLRLAHAGGLLPLDLVWPAGREPGDGVRAEAALRFPDALPAGVAPPLPDWLPELTSALASGEDLAALPSPPPESWLDDVGRAEKSPPPAGK
jgi:hypothetical protein